MEKQTIQKGTIKEREQEQKQVAIEEKIVKDINAEPVEDMKAVNKFIVGIYILLIILGVGTGYLLSGKKFSGASGTPKQQSVIQTDKVVGSTDTKTFKDSAEGTIEKGGINGEGTHKLIREGGPSQTVYLISSVVDLDQYIGKKAKVWGETQAAQQAAWLMDVGKIELE